jgi:integrase
MSFVDIAFLGKKNLKGETLFYRRKKTNQLLEVHLEDCMLDIIQRYHSCQSSPYLLNIVNDPSSNIRRQYLNSSKKINRYLKNIGQELGLPLELTMYCARHSWATIAREKGFSLAVISEGLGHNSEKTTQIYLASLNSEVIDKANRDILKLL